VSYADWDYQKPSFFLIFSKIVAISPYKFQVI